MKIVFISSALLLTSTTLTAQTNCSNPEVIDICPAVHLIGETNAGMIDDASMPCNLPGEDVLYQINAPNGAGHIYISIMNATGPLECTLEQGSCGSGNCSTQMLNAGSSNVNFIVGNALQYYLWINAASTITYDISIGADTGTATINVPNTQGSLQPDSSICALPPFQPAKPFFQVAYNSVYQTAPMTLSPLFVPGTMCITTYFKNTTGVEGIKEFDFDFSVLGYAAVSPVSASLPGFYNSGTWQATLSGGIWKYKFYDTALQNRGDFTGSPNTCLRYVFCFTLTPLSNLPANTNVKVTAFSDGFGIGHSATVRMGCCPVGFLNCLNNGGALGPVAGGSSAFAFGFDDPGGTLPIVLTSFDAEIINKNVIVKWITQSQTNNDFFTVEKSRDENLWSKVATVDGAGNLNQAHSYKIKDDHPYHGTSYYRLKQTDFNGDFTYSKTAKIYMGDDDRWLIYPNPANHVLYVTITGDVNLPEIYNANGNLIKPGYVITGNMIRYDVSHLEAGLYLVMIQDTGGNSKSRKIMVGN